ncbi:MAG: terminase gpP N-terminus-related DNA-binding protein [Flavipsychrobacter sp.]
MATAKKKKPQAKKAPAKAKAKAPAKAAATPKQRLSAAQLEKSKALAFTLFVESGWEQKQIAEATGISENTISAWKRDGNWQEAREDFALGPEKELRRIRALINSKLTEIESRENPFPEPGEADALHKMGDLVKKLRLENLTISHKAAAGKEFVNHVQEVYGQAAAKVAVEQWHGYIMATT